MKKVLAILLATAMVFSLVACAKTTEEKVEEAVEAVVEDAVEEAAVEEAVVEEAVAEAAAEVNAFDDPKYYKWEIDENTEVGFNDYYNSIGVDCDVTIRQKGRVQYITDEEVPLPTPKDKYKIGFSAYYTVDEVSAMYLVGAEQAAEEIGVELLVNDANYDQNHQNQAIEQWCLEGIDACILSACDFYGIQQGLDALTEAGIPTIAYDSSPCAGALDCVVCYDSVYQGQAAGEILEEYLLANNSDMKGTIYYGTLPFVHPNAVSRENGFHSVFDKYEGITIKPLTGEDPEDHYTAFEGILQGDDSIIGLWGLYSSATYGIMNVVKATGKVYPITSVDNDRVILEGIYNGEVVGSVCTNAIEGTRLAMVAAIELIEGRKCPGIIYQANTKVSKDNVVAKFPEYYNGQTLEQYMAGENN